MKETNDPIEGELWILLWKNEIHCFKTKQIDWLWSSHVSHVFSKLMFSKRPLTHDENTYDISTAAKPRCISLPNYPTTHIHDSKWIIKFPALCSDERLLHCAQSCNKTQFESILCLKSWMVFPKGCSSMCVRPLMREILCFYQARLQLQLWDVRRATQLH